jgi:hypothetical protein
MDNVRYKKDLEEHNVIFPKTTPPEPIYYQLEDSLERLYDEWNYYHLETAKSDCINRQGDCSVVWQK